MSTPENLLDETLIENERDVGALRRHMRKLLGEVRKLKGKQNPEQETPRAKFIRENAARLAPFEQGTPEWQAEHDKILAEAQPLIDAEVAEHQARREKEVAHLTSEIERISVDSAAKRIAGGLAIEGSATVLLPHVAARLKAKWNGDKCEVVVTGEDGKEISEEALGIEFREFRTDFAQVIRGASADDKLAHAKRVAEMLGVSKTASRQYTRTEFEALDHQARHDAIAGGAKVVDH